MLIAAPRRDSRFRIVLLQTPPPFQNKLSCPACCDLGAIPEPSQHPSIAAQGAPHRSIPWVLRFRRLCSYNVVSYENVLSCPACCDLGSVLEVTPRPPNRSIPSRFVFSHCSSVHSVSPRKFASLPVLLRFRRRPRSLTSFFGASWNSWRAFELFNGDDSTWSACSVAA